MITRASVLTAFGCPGARYFDSLAKIYCFDYNHYHKDNDSFMRYLLNRYLEWADDPSLDDPCAGVTERAVQERLSL